MGDAGAEYDKNGRSASERKGVTFKTKSQFIYRMDMDIHMRGDANSNIQDWCCTWFGVGREWNSGDAECDGWAEVPSLKGITYKQNHNSII